MVVALIALFIALDGPATAARLIDGKTIKANSISSSKIRNRTLTSADIAKSTWKAATDTKPGSVGGAQLQPGAVGSGAITDKAVGPVDLADGAVTPTQLAADAVTSTKLADGAVGTSAIADGGLQTHDVGDFAGSVEINFKPFYAGTCQTAANIAPTPTSPGAGAVIADDVIIVTPPVGWPDQLTLAANPGAGNTLRIVACNPTNAGADPDTPNTIEIPAGVSPMFQYLGIDQP